MLSVDAFRAARIDQVGDRASAGTLASADRRSGSRRTRLATSMIAAVSMLTASLGTAGPERASVSALLSAISTDADYSDSDMDISPHVKLAVELGDSAIPALARRLDTARGEERQRVETAIAYIGGTRAVRLLQQQVSLSPSAPTKGLLSFAVPSAPTTELSTTLISFLKGPHFGSDWFPIEQSAYSLGVMRERSAIAALRAAAQTENEPSNFASSAAKEALAWIQGSPVRIRFLVLSSDDDLLRSIVASGLPSLGRSTSWCENDSVSRTWQKTSSGWVVKGGCLVDPNTPEISFSGYRSSDGRRAVVAVAFSLGPKDGAGYNYVLRRYGTHWKVVGLQPTWVS